MARAQKIPAVSVIHEPLPRALLDWDLSSIQAAETRADQGDLQQAADLCERLMSDDRIKGVLSVRTSIVRLPLTFEPNGDPRRSAKAIRALHDEGDFSEIAEPSELMRLHAWGVMLGVGLARLEWVDEQGQVRRIRGRNVPRLRIWNPRCLRFDWSTREWKVRTSNVSNEIVVRPGDGEWVIYTPYGASRPWALGAWKACKLWWLSKQFAAQDWNRHNEKNAHGAWVASSTGGKDGSQQPAGTEGQRRELAKKLIRLGREKGFALPPGWKLELIESKSDQHIAFKDLIGVADTANAIAIVGQNLTSEVQGGSFAAATVHKHIATQIIGADGESLSSCTFRQIIQPWARANYADDTIAPYPCWDTSPPEDDQARVSVWVSFGEALKNFRDVGLRVDALKMAESINLPLLADASAELQRTPPTEDTDHVVEDPGDTRSAGEIDESRGGYNLRGGAFAKAERTALYGAGTDSGLERGQSYADRVTEAMTAHGARGLAPTIASMLVAVQKAGSYQEALAEVQARYGKLKSPVELAELAEAALVMAQLGGHHAVNEDTPELGNPKS